MLVSACRHHSESCAAAVRRSFDKHLMELFTCTLKLCDGLSQYFESVECTVASLDDFTQCTVVVRGPA